MANCSVIDFFVKEVMTDQFILQRFEGVFRIIQISPMYSLPIHEIRTAGATMPAFLRRHFLELLEAMQFVLAVG